jgi:fructokinase
VAVLEALGAPGRALIAGEVVIDVRAGSRVVAGAPLHVAAQLRALGWQVSLLGALGRDPDGDWALAVIGELGIDTSLLQRIPDRPTPTVEVRAAEEGGGFVFPTLGALGAAEVPDELPAHGLLVWSALVGVGPGGRERLDELLARSAARLRVFDVNLRPPFVDPAVLRRSVLAANVVKAGRGEVRTVLDALGVPPEVGLWGLFGVARGLEAICESAGPEGARLLLADGRELSAPAPTAEVVDEVGAGDALTAGLAHAFALGMEPGAALGLALERARGVLSQPGGLPPEAPLAARRLAGVLGAPGET